VSADPTAIRWSEIELPDAWTDREAAGWRGVWRLLQSAFLGRHTRVELPEALPLAVEIPRYALQEFHNVPNGNYSKRLTRGYATGFDLAMLGTMDPARRRMARSLAGCRAVLDVGCGGGASTQALVEQGIAEVWGLDPSPYLLRHADASVPGARFVQGLAERTGFADERFDGVACCFVFHEIPPAAEQYRLGALRLARRHGLRALYFRLLARAVHEPFAEAWHRRDTCAWLADHGFDVLEDRTGVPLRTLLCRRGPRS
jgi:SAM-dependent methyltransferase